MKKISNGKISLALCLTVFLAACGGGSGGGGSSNAAPTPITSNLAVKPAAPSGASNSESAVLAELKAKEARQKAEEERKKREALKEEQKKAEETVTASENNEPKLQPKEISYGGYTISAEGAKNSWEGKAADYQIKKDANEFSVVLNKPTTLQIGDTRLELLDNDKVDLGYYGYVSMFTPDSGIVGEGSGEKRSVELLYAFDDSKKDDEAPRLNGYQGTVTYSGNFFYIADITDQVSKAEIEFNYNPSAKTMAGKVRDNSGIDLDLKLAGELNGDFIMSADPSRAHTSTRVSEKGSLNAQFLDGGKYIVGDAASGDNKQWKGVFGTQEAGRVPANP